MFELKKLPPDSVEAALERARQYRMLNEPRQAESICLDVLEVDAANQPALITLLLARTDQFARRRGTQLEDARELLPRLEGKYVQHYYAGIVYERWGKAHLNRGAPGSGPLVYRWLREAMQYYEKAEAVRHPGNDDPLLRWNTCARLIMNHERVGPTHDDEFHPLLE